MKANVDQIAEHFSLAAHTYDAFSSPQQHIGQKLIDTILAELATDHFINLVDLGCGTGYLTEQLHQRLGRTNTVGMDVSPAMVQLASSTRDPSIHWRCADIATCHPAELLGNNRDFEKTLVFSNCCLQWLGEDLSSWLEQWWQAGCALAFSVLLDSSFQAWRQRYQELDLPCPLFRLPNQTELENQLQKLATPARPVSMQTLSIQQPYTDGLAFAQSLKRTGAQTSEQPPRPDHLRQVLRLDPGPLVINYDAFLMTSKFSHSA